MQDSLTPNLSWAPIETCPSAFPPLLLAPSLSLFVSHTPLLHLCLHLYPSVSPCAFPLQPRLSLINSSLLLRFPSTGLHHLGTFCHFHRPRPVNNARRKMVLMACAQSFCPAVLQGISVSECPASSDGMRCGLLGCFSMCQDYQVWQGRRQEWGLGCHVSLFFS